MKQRGWAPPPLRPPMRSDWTVVMTSRQPISLLIGLHACLHLPPPVSFFFFVSRSFPFFSFFFFSRRMKEGMTNRRGKRRRRRHRSHSQPHDNLRFKCVLIFSIVVTEMNKNWNRSSTSFHTHTHIKSFDPKWIQRVRKKASWFNPLMQMRRTCSSSSNSRFPRRGEKKRGRVSMRAQLTVDTNGKEKRSRNFKCQR